MLKKLTNLWQPKIEKTVNVVRAVIIIPNEFHSSPKVMIIERPATLSFPGNTLVGGKVESGEDFLSALRREIAEELGVDESRIFIYPDSLFEMQRQADHTAYNQIYFRCLLLTGELAPQVGEVAGIKYAFSSQVSGREFPFEDDEAIKVFFRLQDKMIKLLEDCKSFPHLARLHQLAAAGDDNWFQYLSLYEMNGWSLKDVYFNLLLSLYSVRDALFRLQYDDSFVEWHLLARSIDCLFYQGRYDRDLSQVEIRYQGLSISDLLQIHSQIDNIIPGGFANVPPELITEA